MLMVIPWDKSKAVRILDEADGPATLPALAQLIQEGTAAPFVVMDLGGEPGAIAYWGIGGERGMYLNSRASLAILNASGKYLHCTDTVAIIGLSNEQVVKLIIDMETDGNNNTKESECLD